MPSRVLLIAHQYWPTPGAATQVLNSLVASLRGLGASVDVVTTAPRAGLERISQGPHGESIHYGPGPEGEGAGLARLAQLAQFARAVGSIASRIDFDVVVSDPPPTAAAAALRAAKRAGRPFVYYLADSWGGASKGARAPLARLAHPMLKGLEDATLRRASLVVAATSNMAAIARQAGTSDVVTVHNGVPLDTFAPVGEQWRPDPSSRPFLVYAGNAGLVHGAEVFADAADALWRSGRDFGLVYMGYGSDLDRVERVRTEWPDRLSVTGVVPPEMVAAALRGSVGALSSLRPVAAYADARPIKTLCGLATGTPAVFAGRGAMADVITDQQLGYVAPWSVAGAATVMSAALDAAADEEAFVRLRQHCADYARDHFDDRLGADLVARRVLSLAAATTPRREGSR